MNAFVAEVGRLLREHPEQWDFSDRYAVKHNPSGLELWTANGWLSMDVCKESRVPGYVPLRDRFRLWGLVREARSAAGLAALKGGGNGE